MNISATPTAQPWLSQFTQADRKTAEKLLNQLVYVSTDNVITALGEHISALIKIHNKVAIFPVRELIKIEEYDSEDLNGRDGNIESDDDIDEKVPPMTESYFPLDDDNAAPVVQPNDITLGSEAFVSNLITQLGRRYGENIISPEGNGLNPTIHNLREQRVKSLILVDDLIGSGDRTKSFLESVYQHPTIKSWLSGNLIQIHIVSYMASANGAKLIERWCKKHQTSTLHILNKCPMLDINDEAIVDLCKRYADKNEKHPIGYGHNPVRVVFSHSAPNNLPVILFRDRTKLKAKDLSLRAIIKTWKALFPRRALTETQQAELSAIKPTISTKLLLEETLSNVDSNPGINTRSLNELLIGSDTQKSLCKSRCLKFGWLREDNEMLFLTEQGKRELNFINKNRMLKTIANNEDNYYPPNMSRAMSHQD